MSRPQLSADTAYFSPAQSPPQPLFPDVEPKWSTGARWTQPAEASSTRSAMPTKSLRPLQFAPGVSSEQLANQKIELPRIEPYLPQGVDADAVDSLVLVYQSHCSLAVDNFKFCRTALFQDGYKSLTGQLTVPAQKLLAHPDISNWIRECDWLKYQRMIAPLERQLLHNVPTKGLEHIGHVAKNVCSWIHKYFGTQPDHVMDAMLGPAHVFVGVIERFFRVQQVTRDIADLLEDPETRTSLWEDWVRSSDPLGIVSNSLLFHERGHRALIHLLTKDIRFLLSPTYETVPTMGTLFENDESPSEFQLRDLHVDRGGEDAPIQARLFRFLADLPARFHLDDARQMLNFVETITGNMTRNMTLAGSADLPKWWQIKLFVDEAMYWLAERGGVMGSGARAITGHANLAGPLAHATGSLGPDNDFDFSRPVTAHTNNGDMGQGEPPLAHGHPNPELPEQRPMIPHSTSMPIRSPAAAVRSPGLTRKRRHSASTVGEDEVEANGNDDSGIGLVDEDFGDPKYNAFVQFVHGSDPADVVVR